MKNFIANALLALSLLTGACGLATLVGCGGGSAPQGEAPPDTAPPPEYVEGEKAQK